ncbi:unnamed protein product [Sphenostylis stenocarpa]|uniref:Uncharacterized protein n=1 Tax=Sphenostylis stenocarpa TaxID=92480 RepID=A0AA86T509_9FABA|nr:unnamed protein product [Sphenostylis stenocarpa]
MSNHNIEPTFEFMKARQEAKGYNDGTSDHANINSGCNDGTKHVPGNHNFSDANVNPGAKVCNDATADSFNNHGSGNQNFSNSKINSGAYAGDQNTYNTSNNYGGRTINNSGTFIGNGNGGFNSSTSNYYY